MPETCKVSIYGREVKLVDYTREQLDDLLKDKRYPDTLPISFEEWRDGRLFVRGQVMLSYLRDTVDLPIKTLQYEK